MQKFLTLSGHLFAPYVWVVNMDFWKGLTPAEQIIAEKHGAEGEAMMKAFLEAIAAASK